MSLTIDAESQPKTWKEWVKKTPSKRFLYVCLMLMFANAYYSGKSEKEDARLIAQLFKHNMRLVHRLAECKGVSPAEYTRTFINPR